jgi:hypothetical protein
VTLPFQAFNSDGHDIAALIICGGPAPGTIDLSIDQVQLEYVRTHRFTFPACSDLTLLAAGA